MDYLSINKEAWDKRTNVHVKSEFYDVASFKNGRCSLNPIELKQVGNVEGSSLLHLQCHFGQDTLSWALLGAEVTGVDLSAAAIKQANSLKQALGLRANFIESDIVKFGSENTQHFDIVFTSYGVLCWPLGARLRRLVRQHFCRGATRRLYAGFMVRWVNHCVAVCSHCDRELCASPAWRFG